MAPSDIKTQPIGRELFVTTRWTVVLAASDRNLPEASRALEELCQTYWYPLYAYVRRRGSSKEDAEDLVQGFFTQLLNKNGFASLRHEKGKFRAFLLASLKHFLANASDRAGRKKRGGGIPDLSLDWQDADSRYQVNPAVQLSPDKLYDRAWVVALLEAVLGRLRQESTDAGKKFLFEKLKPFLSFNKETIPYRQVAQELDLSEAALRVAVHRLRKRYRELLREEVAQTLSDPAQFAEEMRSLMGAFAE